MPQEIPDAWLEVGTILASATVLRVHGYKAFFDASPIATQPVGNSNGQDIPPRRQLSSCNTQCECEYYTTDTKALHSLRSLCRLWLHNSAQKQAWLSRNTARIFPGSRREYHFPASYKKERLRLRR
jgi:hypothetical protein